MVLRSSLLVLFLLACHTDRLRPVTKCGQPCGSKETYIGECKPGVWSCGDSEEDAVCVGEVLSSVEVCDNRDNNCDGKVDNMPGRDCGDLCGPATEICEEGVWNCYGRKTPKPEVCDNKDNDCDGIVDNIVYNQPFCYTGNMATIAKGECRPGFSQCVLGMEICYGQVLPKAETCDGKDNDCDGPIDEGVGSSDPIDIVFVIDNSGSMTPHINKVKVAVNLFVVKYGSKTHIKWALVAAPADDNASEIPQVVAGFVDAVLFNVAMQQQDGLSLTGNEPTLDALAMLCDYTSNPLMLNWTPNSKRILVFFTDEGAQSYTTPYRAQHVVAADCARAGPEMYFFADGSWTQLAMDSGATLYSVYDSVTTIESNLDNVLKYSVCQ